MPDYQLVLENITKVFPGVTALDNVNISVKRGEIHGLCGENGAGKSTLINILSGVYPYGSYRGDIYVNGELKKFSGITDAKKEGIVCIHQELALFQELSVAENLFMGNQPHSNGIIKWNELYSKSKEHLKKLDLHLSLDTKIKDLGSGQKQLVEIVKSLVKQPRVLILDEPTSSLSEHEVDLLLNLLDSLRKEGITCIYISHKLDEIIRISDTVTVLRDGHAMATMPTKDISKKEIIRHMIGREMKDFYPRVPHKRGELVMEVKDYSVYDPDVPERKKVDNISFKAYKGEILGFSGLVGAGRTELFSSIYGTYGYKKEGEILIDGKQVQLNNPNAAIKEGYFLATEDRKRYGVNLLMDVKENTTLGSLKKVSKFMLLNRNKEISETEKYINYLRIKTPSFATKVMNLSGGNQQKVVLAKAMMIKPRILVFDEPTRGIDVGAKYEIYKIMNQFVEEGIVVIMISSEMEEIMGMSDRVIVIHEGKKTADLDISEATQENLMNALMGVN
ncbi:MAG: sugar ABC transporter ATP-binding protein [Christensenellales bacterium]